MATLIPPASVDVVQRIFRLTLDVDKLLLRMSRRRQAVTASTRNQSLIIREAIILLDRVDRGELIAVVNPDYNRDREK